MGKVGQAVNERQAGSDEDVGRRYIGNLLLEDLV